MGSEVGPQKGPASTGRLRAQQRQLQRQLEEDKLKPVNDDRFCVHCNYGIIEVPTTSGVMRFCSKCFRPA